MKLRRNLFLWRAAFEVQHLKRSRGRYCAYLQTGVPRSKADRNSMHTNGIYNWKTLTTTCPGLHPQNNGMRERLHRTIQEAFYAIVFRNTLYPSLKQLQVDLNDWFLHYTLERPNSDSTGTSKQRQAQPW